MYGVSKKERCIAIIILLVQITVLLIIGVRHPNQGSGTIHVPEEFWGGAGELTEQGWKITEEEGYKGIFTSLMGLDLPRGSYQVVMQYVTDGSANVCSVYSETASYGSVKADSSIKLKPYQHSVEFTVILKEKVDDLQIFTNYGGNGSLIIGKIEIKPTDDLYRVDFCMVVLIFLIIDALLILMRKKDYQPAMKEMVSHKGAILIIIVLVSIPLFTDYLFQGDDINFHLMRIEGLVEGLTSRQFPVKIQPGWLNNRGYAVSVMYGDFLLYFPAILRMIGFSLQDSYKMYIVLINILTAFSSYYCFTKILKSSKAGIVCCLLYTGLIYRMVNVYVRAAVGEYTAMIFLPIVLYGLYKLLYLETEGADFQNTWLILTIGCSGIIQSHILSVEMIAMIGGLSCLVCWRRLVRKETIRMSLKAIAAIIVLNLGFIVPFLDYMLHADMAIKSAEFSAEGIQSKGIYISQLFSMFPNFEVGEMYGADGARGRQPMMLGLWLVAGAVGWLYFWIGNRVTVQKKTRYMQEIVFLIAVLTVWMSTICFPWDKMSKLCGPLGAVINKIQFPWRFLGIAGMLLVLVAGYLYLYVEQAKSQYGRALILGIVSCSIISIVLFNDGISVKNGYAWKVNDSSALYDLNTTKEYRPVDLDYAEIASFEEIISKNVVIHTQERDSLNYNVFCQTNSDIGELEFPLLYYPGYQATMECGDVEEKLSVTSGNNYRVKVEVPANSEARIRLRFVEPWYWRVAEIISMVAVVGICVGYFRTVYMRRK